METLVKIFQNLLQYLSSAEWQKLLALFKSLSLVFSLLLFVALVILIFLLRGALKKSLEMITESVVEPALPKRAVVEKWQSVLDKLEKGDENSYKMAVIEADKILDDILKRIGYPGEDMGERLKQIAPGQIANLDELWQAHRVRNQIVHNPDFRLTRAQAKRAVEIYQRALEDLEAV